MDGVLVERCDSIAKHAKITACYFGYYWIRCLRSEPHQCVVTDKLALDKIAIHKSGKYRKK